MTAKKKDDGPSITTRFKETLDRIWPLNLASLADSHLSMNTRKAYRADLAHYLGWGGTLPATKDMLVNYIDEFKEDYSVRTTRRRIVAINEAHTALGLESPGYTREVKKTLVGVGKQYAEPPKKAKPFMIQHASLLMRHLDGSPSGIRDKALILLGWSGYFRRSELVAITVEKITFHSDRMIIERPRGKTNQENGGKKVPIPAIGGPACPVAAVKSWLALSGISQGPLFRRVFRGGTVHAEARSLTGHTVSLVLKKRCQEAGVDEAELFSGHSLRRGGITQAYAADENESDIQFISGHQSIGQLRTYRDEAEALSGHQASMSFLRQLNDELNQDAD